MSLQVISDPLALIESQDHKELEEALCLYPQLIARRASRQSLASDGDKLRKVMQILSLTPAAVTSDTAAVQQAASVRGRILSPEQLAGARATAAKAMRESADAYKHILCGLIQAADPSALAGLAAAIVSRLGGVDPAVNTHLHQLKQEYNAAEGEVKRAESTSSEAAAELDELAARHPRLASLFAE